MNLFLLILFLGLSSLASVESYAKEKDNNELKEIVIQKDKTSKKFSIDPFIKELQENKLKALNFGGIYLTDLNGADEISEALKNNTSLETLNIGHNNCSNEGIFNLFETLEKNKTLTYLNASYTRHIFDDADIPLKFCLPYFHWFVPNIISNEMLYTQMKKTLIKNQGLKVLDLSGNKFSSEAIKHISQGLSENKYLEELYLRNCGMEMQHAKYLVEALTKSSLKIFDASGNKIGSDGFALFMVALATNCTLVELDLSRNNIEYSNLVDAKNGFIKSGKNKSLKKLFLQDNALGDAGLRKLVFNILNNLETLEHLNLSKNRIKSLGLNCFCKNDRETKSELKTVCFSKNEIRDKSLELLLRSLWDQPELYQNITFDLTGMLFSKEVKNKIYAKKERIYLNAKEEKTYELKDAILSIDNDNNKEKNSFSAFLKIAKNIFSKNVKQNNIDENISVKNENKVERYDDIFLNPFDEKTRVYFDSLNILFDEESLSDTEDQYERLVEARFYKKNKTKFERFAEAFKKLPLEERMKVQESILKSVRGAQEQLFQKK